MSRCILALLFLLATSASYSLGQQAPPAAPEAAPATAPQATAPEARTDMYREREIPEDEREPPKNDFELFVAATVGKELPLFGSDLFAEVPSTFAPLEHVPVPADYVLGPGDELRLHVWGQVDLAADLVVDRNGQVFIPHLGSMAVAGLRYEQLHPYLQNALGRIYQNFEFNVGMGRLRSIQVLLVGNARRPGTYTVSSLSTLLNALFAAGGPSSTGSMRRIQLRRTGRLVTEFDLYDLLLRGDKSRDAQLLTGDVIFIPPVGSMAAIHGATRRPAIYELHGETKLEDLIELAGGLSTTATRSKVLVERIFENRIRRVEELALDEEGLLQLVRDGDIVTVFPISPRFDNAVTLRGNVARAGRYEWFPGMRILDLIPGREHLVAPELWEQINVATGRLRGHEIYTGLRSLVLDVNWDYALIQRTDLQQLTTRLLPFHLGEAVLNGNLAENHLLEPGDTVFVFAERDLRVPTEKQAKFVILQGELNGAGVYRAQANETLRDLVRRAGGYAANAFPRGAEFFRVSVRERQQRALEQFIHEMELEVQRAALEGLGQIGDSAQAEARQDRLELTRRLVARLRTMEASGRVVLDFGDSVDEVPAIPLEDGDLLIIPSEPSSVSVMGMVYNQGDFLFESNRSVRDYLQLAGGTNRDADSDRIYVIRANGVVATVGSGGFWRADVRRLRVEPGDTIVVPHQLYRGQFRRQMLEWAQIVGQFGLGAAAVRVLMR